MKVQEALRSDWTLTKLSEKLGIEYRISDNLVTLNYSQIDSPKTHPIVMECRGLVLEMDTWEVVGRSFPRFFNYGENREIENKFDWKSIVAETKEDGSLSLLFNYKDNWRFNTRGSFAEGEIAPGCGITWKDAFRNCINSEKINSLPKTHTFVFEYCSIYNKVVRHYSEPALYLLTAFHNKSGTEASEVLCDNWAKSLGVKRPERFVVNTVESLINFIESHPEPTFEGCVIRDKNGTRIKIKNPRYVALHRLKGNGNLFLYKNIIPLVMSGEDSEILLHFPEAAAKVFNVIEVLSGLKARLKSVWQASKGIESQKDFALYVNKYLPKLSSILFTARKTGKDIEELWKESEDKFEKLFVD